MELEAEKKPLDPLTSKVIGCALEVHCLLGPGLLESAYEHCLAHELTAASIPFRRRLELPVHYKGDTLDYGFRVNLLVAEQLVIELKSVDSLPPVHQAQPPTYLRLAR